MGKAMTVLVGAFGMVVLLPLSLSGLGEAAVSIPAIGVCMATFAAIVLRAAPRN